jgi:hypothetical protein
MRALILFLVAAFTMDAADRTAITWSPDKAELSWTSTTDGKTKYVINYRTRVMTKNGRDAKRFSEEEAFVWLRNFIGVESYAVQSEDWHVNPEKFEEQHRRVAPPSSQANRASYRK